MSNDEMIEKLKILDIESMCYLTYPCIHNVTILENKQVKKTLMRAMEIINYYKENDLPIPEHFTQYDTDECHKKFNKK